MAAHLIDPTLPLPKPSVGLAVATAYRREGLSAAVHRYHVLRSTGADRWNFDESALNGTGFWLLERGAVDDAVAVFRLNAEQHPAAPEPYHGLGDAYRAAGRLEGALASYRRAFDLAEAVNHPELPRYRSSLERVREQQAPPK